MNAHVEVEFTAKGKTIARFRADGVRFWEGVIREVSEEEGDKWIPKFDNLPSEITYVDPNFVETLWEICIFDEYVSQDYDTLETVPDLLKIMTKT